jgi:hypothetical protein
MTLLDKKLVGGLPGVADAGGLTIGESHGVNRVSIIVIKMNRY